MTATTMHFGPEWMRKPQMPNRPHPPPSPPVPSSAPLNNNHGTSPSGGASTYSALVTPAAPEPETRDESHPFRYSKEEMLRIFREGGGRGGLGLEVERHEGIVREVGSEPTGLREMSDAEKKLFAGPLNSELRRRQSGDVVNTLSNSSDRPRLGHNNSAGPSPMRERFGSLMGRRRDSTDQPPLTIPRKLSMSNTQSTAASPRDAALPSPRIRMGGFGSGIDGVLSNSDSWVARRRASESTKPGGNVSRDAIDSELKGPDIKEEEEAHTSTDASQSDIATTDMSSTGAHPLDENHVANGVASMAFNDGSPIPQNAPNPSFSSPIPPGLPGNPDPSTVEWSYIDPSGTVQGPFTADIMQKWHEEGYFTLDLLMKRTHIDREFVSVGELVRRAGGGKTFLSQPPLAGPPGLVPQTDSPLHNIPNHQANMFSGQSPVPIRNLRAATLDSYLNANSDSPGSSFDARFTNGSPDPSAFGGRAGLGMHAGDSPFNARGYPGRPFNEPLPDPHSPFGNTAPGRPSSMDTYSVYNNNMGAPQWVGQTENINQHGDVDTSVRYHAFNHAAANIPRGAVGQSFIPETMSRQPMNAEYGDMNGLGGQFDRALHGRGSVTNGMGITNANLVYNNSPFVHNQIQLAQSPSVPTTIPQSLSHFSDTQPSNATITPGMNPLPSQVQSLNEPSSTWTNTDPLLTRPGATDSPRVSAATLQNQVNQPASHLQQAWSRGSQSPQQGVKRDQSPWLAASQSGTDDSWKEVPGPNSLTFDNVGQHNMMQEEAEEGNAQVVDGGHVATTDAHVPVEAAMPTLEVPSEPEQSEPEPMSAVPEVQAPTPSRSRRKAGTKDTQVQATTTVKTTPPSPPNATSPPTPSVPAAVSKAAWLMEDDTKKTKAGMTLREIQEDEARRAEARKTEKERERATRAGAPITSALEEVFTTTAWGLPTSQAGSRTVASPSTATPTSAGAATSAAPAPWSQPVNVATAKKTMKEIQEEEEQRKKTVQKETVAAATSRRGYAETTTKPLTPTPAAGGAWTTVGPSGKSAAVAAGTRPPPTPTATSASVATATAAGSRSNAVVPPRTAASAVAKGTLSVQKADDFPVAPSADFLRWLGENLKGLNSSVNLEEISSMLLSFPLDPDSSTLELIAEMIYTNSTTLDGRRFASEFVNKRKTDAAARKGGANTGPAGKVVSIADVVKTQPKPSQPEWGFKVVNKKKKGGRA